MQTSDIISLREKLCQSVQDSTEKIRTLKEQAAHIQSEIDETSAGLETTIEELRKFDDIFGQRLRDAGEKVNTPTAARSSKAQERGGKKQSPKHTNPKAEKVVADTRAAQGRRAVMAGERPTMKDSLIGVMLDKRGWKSDTVHAALEERGWLPDAKDPLGHVRHVLSSMSDVFLREGRGIYYVAPAALADYRKRHETDVVSPKKAPAGISTDEILAEAGISLPQTSSAPAN